MKTKEEIKEQIKELQTQLESLNKGFEVGKWYIHLDGAIICVTEVLKNDVWGYGIYQGEWEGESNSWFCPDDINDSNFREATKEEVEEALIKEAENRGFKDAKRIKPASGLIRDTCGFGKTLYMSGDCLCIGDEGIGLIIFKDGKWAEIIEDKFTIAGHEVEIGIPHRIACCEFYTQDLRSLSYHLEEYNITSFKHKILGEIKTSELKDLLNHINKQ